MKQNSLTPEELQIIVKTLEDIREASIFICALFFVMLLLVLITVCIDVKRLLKENKRLKEQLLKKREDN